MNEQKQRAGWKPGQSGNPRGRRPGTGEVAKLRAGIAKHVPDIISKLVDQAKAGDAGAARLLLERVLPPMRATDPTITFDLIGDTLAEQGRAVIAAAGAGKLAPAQASQLLAGLVAVAKLVESDDLAARVAALEARYGQQ